jgi:hypothetical protein
LIDHQSGIMQLVHDYPPAEFRNNVMALAKLGKVYKLPTVLTTSLGQGPNGPFFPEVLSHDAVTPEHHLLSSFVDVLIRCTAFAVSSAGSPSPACATAAGAARSTRPAEHEAMKVGSTVTT